MFQTLIKAFKNKEIRTKIFITLALLLVYRIGSWLPVPGISASVQASVADDNLLGLLNAITGGALKQGAFLAIGISPYINASIIIQLLTVAIPPLERLSKMGDEGKKKITKITRIVTLILATAQAIGIVVQWANNDGIASDLFGETNTPVWVVGMFVVIILVAGSTFTTWLGERITDLQVGNGISLLIFVGIISSAGQSILKQFQDLFGGSATAGYKLLGFVALVIVIFTLIVWIDSAERRVPIQYAKQIKGRKQYGGQSTNIPIKINASGVLPIIFAMALVTFPQLIFNLAGSQSGAYQTYQNIFGAGKPVYYVVVGVLILFFSYFYAQIQFNPEEVARNIQQYGGFVPGIRPGKPTSDYIARISRRLTFFGAVFLTFIAIVPALAFSGFNDQTLVNTFSSTGLLIVVSVALEFNKQLESQLMMKHYKGFLK